MEKWKCMEESFKNFLEGMLWGMRRGRFQGAPRGIPW